jgi:hypothetical protein
MPLSWVTTPVKDATADYLDREMNATLDINIPSFTSAIVTTEELLHRIASL